MDTRENASSVHLETALRTFMRDSSDFAFLKDSGFVYLEASDAFATMAGFPSADAVIGKTDYELFSKDLADKYRMDDERVLDGLVIDGIIERLPEEDGEERWTRTWKRAIRDDADEIIGLYGIGRDVSRMMGLESEVKAAERYSDLIRNIPGGVAIFHNQDGALLIDYANDGWFDALHISRDHSRHYREIDAIEGIYEPDRARVREEFLRIEGHDGAQGDVTYRSFGEDGRLHWIGTQFRAAYTEDGTSYFYASCTDLDKEKRTEDKLRENETALSEAIENSDIQFFSYYPDLHRCEIHTLNKRLDGLKTHWDDFPESFIAETGLSSEDADLYRAMVAAIDAGEAESSCTVRFFFQGVYLWERIKLRAVHDSDDGQRKVLGYSLNITDRMRAEERLQKERLRLKSLEGNVFEAFTFNLSKRSDPDIQTSDADMLQGEVDEDIVEEALRICPLLADTNPATLEILLRAAQRIPDAADRELFITTCSSDALRTAVNEGRYNAEIRYRRYVGNRVLWVASVAEVLPDPDTNDLIAFYYTRDINEEVIHEKISYCINSRYCEKVSYLDMHSGMLFVHSMGDPADTSFAESPYQDTVDAMIRTSVLPSEAEDIREKTSIETIVSELEHASTYTLYYTMSEHDETLPKCPLRRMKNDIFYLDEHRDVLVFLISDVTEVFAQERENRDRMAQALMAAEQASVAKTEFLSRMSHEIRTPMNAIIGLDAIALQEEGISATMEDHLQKIGISARFLLSLINDILDMSRIESGRMALRNEPFDFEQMVNSINTILFEQCRDSGLDYECVLKSFTESTYVGDETKLQQVLVNILGNAVKFTPKGGKVHFMIEQIQRTKDTARLRFEIADTGIGIDEQFLPHLFDAFSQEDRGRTSTYGGSGLGLAISKNIVSLMGGDIAVHSIKNVGSEFTVEVDLGLSQDSVRRHSLLDASIRQLYTLIVDDDVIVCQHTQMVLDEAGLKTEWVDSGAAAIAKVTEQHRARADYDLILLDWQMPDMDGVETAREIRRIVGPDVTIIIMTAYDWADIEKKAKAAGVDMFMKKPVFASSVAKAFEAVFLGKRNVTEPDPEPEYDFSGRHVLLAEDNDLNAEIAASILEMKGCAVEVARNGAEAVESFAAAPAGHFDAVLMDVRMPVMDGLEAARTIRAMRKSDSKTVPIIAMTANAFQEDVKQSLESGMDAHLAKPIEPPLFYETLNRCFLDVQTD